MKSTAIYMRVSTRAQDMAAQEPDLKRWAAAHDDSVVWYRDTFTGKSMDRPGWNKLTDAVHSGKIAKVVVWRLDRLGRTAKGLTALFEELAQKKVNLISLRDGIDLHTAAGRLMANVLASVAQYETEVRAERVREVGRFGRQQHLHQPVRTLRVSITPGALICDFQGTYLW